MEVDEVNEIDEFQAQFEQLDLSEKVSNEKLTDYLLLLRNPRTDESANKIKEQCIYRLAKIYTENAQFSALVDLLKSNNDFFATAPKAKTAKIVRNILNIVATVPNSLSIQVELCKDVIAWCKAEKRTFLRQRIEGKLAGLLLQQQQPVKALELIDELLGELRKLDDKQMLTEAHLTESRIYHALKNIPKAKASLTACRTAANSIYVVPLLQAEIDEMSGTLHCEEGDYTTAYSYFLEAFDAYSQNNVTSSAVSCLKYMMLSKILNESPHEVAALMVSKMVSKYQGPHLAAMGKIALSAKSRSLEEFKAAISEFSDQLTSDTLISHHLDLLYDKMLESNLLKIIHPFSTVEINYVSKLINLSPDVVVQKLSQMILDHKFSGILDEGRGHLIIYDSSSEDLSFAKGVKIIGNLNAVVDVLFQRAKGLSRVATI